MNSIKSTGCSDSNLHGDQKWPKSSFIDNQHHNLPHIHAKYAEFEASIGIEDGEILAGELQRKQLRLVQAWIELHRDELKADWEIATSGEKP